MTETDNNKRYSIIKRNVPRWIWNKYRHYVRFRKRVEGDNEGLFLQHIEDLKRSSMSAEQVWAEYQQNKKTAESQ